MNSRELIQHLKELGTEQNVKIYKKHGAKEPLFGVSFANLDKLKKTVVSNSGKKGVNHELALELWATGNSDVQTFAAKIMEADKLDKEWAINQAKTIKYHIIADQFASVLTKSKYADEFINEMINSDNEYEKRIAYSIINNKTRASKVEPSYFEKYILKIKNEIQSAPNRAKEAMNNCLIAIGAINQKLREKAVEASKIIGPVEIDHGDTSCQTFIIEEYLDRIYKRRESKK